MQVTDLCSTDDLDVEHTVICGQTFRWRQDADRWWSCLLTESVTRRPFLVRLHSENGRVLCQTDPENLPFVRSYLRLEVDLVALSQEFLAADPNIAPAVAAFPGLRVLRQDPVECLFSFLCASAAPLHRIRKGIDGLCRMLGERYDDPLSEPRFAFPSVEQIAETDLADLQSLGVGYRARYLQTSARQILANGGAPWLLSLRDASYEDAKAALLPLTGIGEKVADCIVLFCMDKDNAIPVDTHIRQIVERHYLIGRMPRSLTKNGYALIGDTLRNRFGPMAGWAQQYLFYADTFEKKAWGAYEAQYRATEVLNL
ncbi:8-oxoguanine DNA glycosylase [Capsulimonas corticalis]|uniref:DNA-(apurinic or apyrimidinic site) lyase n=1 Tax=Capsulimonas corticalis TaxID=2219043 RepID=A0A402CX23_9BACT|nr:DNA glycosylase [Capsulimonas corticalis]BDI34347.1 8-oxoguanine DNA glycosylase [Capsulimonas corticalis]